MCTTSPISIIYNLVIVSPQEFALEKPVFCCENNVDPLGEFRKFPIIFVVT